MKSQVVSILLLICLILIVPCWCVVSLVSGPPNCPLFKSREKCLSPDFEILEEVRPFVERWATLPPEQTKQERDEFARSSEKVHMVDVMNYRMSDGREVVIVDVLTDVWYEWWHGYIYVHNREDLGTEFRGGTLTRIDDHFYIYNWND